jgi:hypothetical protein
VIDYIDLVKNIFKIYNFVLELRMDGIEDSKNMRDQIKDIYENKLQDIINAYSNILRNSPAEKLYSKDILMP